MACMHHDNFIGQSHGFDLVMGDIDHGRAQPLFEGGNLGAHVDTQGGIEIGQRLVKKKQPRIAHDGAANGDTLALPARQFARLALKQRIQPQNLCGRLDPRADIGLINARQTQRIAHVFGNGHMRIERIVLKDHGNAAIGG